MADSSPNAPIGARAVNRVSFERLHEVLLLKQSYRERILHLEYSSRQVPMLMQSVNTRNQQQLRQQNGLLSRTQGK